MTNSIGEINDIINPQQLREASRDEDDFYDKNSILIKAADQIEELNLVISGLKSILNRSVKESRIQKDIPKTPADEVADYLFSDEYSRLLYRAVLSRLATSSNNKDKHMKAINLLQKAFPNLSP